MKDFIKTWSTVFFLWAKMRKVAVKLWGEEYVKSIDEGPGMFS